MTDTASTDIALTICIPTYQRPGLVQRAIRSAVDASAGSADSVEIIVSDNSPEVTSQLCRDALAQWPGRALYLGNVPNLGMIPNLNQCVARASGRYVLFLHDDDYLLPGATSAMLGAIRAVQQDAALLFGVQVVDGDGRLRRHQCFKQEEYLAPSDAVLRMLSDPSFVRAPAVIVRRDAFETVGMWDESVGSPTDFDLWLRVFSRYGVRCLTATTSAYSVHEVAETTRMFTAETVHTLLRIFDRAATQGLLPASVVRDCEAEYFHQFLLAGVGRRLRVGDREGADRIMSLFRLPELSVLGVPNRWRPIRYTMQLLISTPPKFSRAILEGAQVLVNATLPRLRAVRATASKSVSEPVV